MKAWYMLRCGVVVASLMVGGTVSVWAEEGLLWKVNSRYQPFVVLPYTNQPSPFPVEVKQENEDEKIATEIMETERVQQEAVVRAKNLLASSQALVPYMDGMAVGGMVEGAQGRKVLIGNEWIGGGMELTVRLTASDQMKKALDDVNEFDPTTASELRVELTQKLQQNPATKLRLKEIRSNALVLQGPYGQKILNFNIQ